MNRLVAVCGGTDGLGFAIVKKHLALGDEVLALGRHEREALIELEQGPAGEHLRFVPCDVSSTPSVEEAGECIRKNAEGKSLSFLYHCAGIIRPEDRVPLRETDLDAALPVFNVNALGFLRVVKTLLPLIDPETRILCVSSEAGSIGACHRSREYSYAMSKCAENMACAILQRSLDEDCPGARVLAVHPGWMRTHIGGETAALDPAESAEELVRLAQEMDSLPRDNMFVNRKGEPMPW